MGRTIAQLVALAVVVASGVAHGLWTGRWGQPHQLEPAVARLGRVPAAVGDWEGRELPLNRQTLAVAEVAGHVSRRYQNSRTGESVLMLLVCGRPGPISVHTPDVCYEGAGYAARTAPAD